MYKRILKETLINDEGKENIAYLCSEGYLSIAIGHNCITSPVDGVTKVGDWVSDKVITKLFNKDMAIAELYARRVFPDFIKLSDNRKVVLVSMVFQMGGSGVSKFKNMLKALDNHNYGIASEEMLDSRWAKQTPSRAKRLSIMMKEG